MGGRIAVAGARMVPAVPVLALLTVLSGCSEEPASPAPFTPSPTPSVSQTPSPSGPVEPTLPAAAQGEGRAAAKAFVTYYVELLNYLQATGDGEPARRAAHRDCEFCAEMIGGVEAIYERGGSIRGGRWQVSGWGLSSPRVAGDYSFVFEATYGPQWITGPNPSRDNGGKSSFVIDVRRAAREWRTTWFELVQ